MSSKLVETRCDPSRYGFLNEVAATGIKGAAGSTYEWRRVGLAHLEAAEFNFLEPPAHNLSQISLSENILSSDGTIDEFM